MLDAFILNKKDLKVITKIYRITFYALFIEKKIQIIKKD